MKRLSRWYRSLCQAEEILAQVLLTLTVIIIFVSAVARTVGSPLVWSMDMATFLFAWAAFFGADVALRSDRHVAVEFFINLLPPRGRTMVRILNYLIILAFLGFLVWYGVSMSTFTRFRAFQGIPGFSYMWATFSVPAGSLLLAFTTIGKIRQLLAELKGGQGGSWSPAREGDLARVAETEERP